MSEPWYCAQCGPNAQTVWHDSYNDTVCANCYGLLTGVVPGFIIIMQEKIKQLDIEEAEITAKGFEIARKLYEPYVNEAATLTTAKAAAEARVAVLEKVAEAALQYSLYGDEDSTAEGVLDNALQAAGYGEAGK